MDFKPFLGGHQWLQVEGLQGRSTVETPGDDLEL